MKSFRYTLQKTDGEFKNGHSRDTGNNEQKQIRSKKSNKMKPQPNAENHEQISYTNLLRKRGITTVLATAKLFLLCI